MISNREKQWYYHSVKELSPYKHHGDIHCLNCLHCFSPEKDFESHKKVCKNKDFCNVTRHFVDIEILEFNQYQKADKAPFIIYADLEGIIILKIILKIHLQQK